MNPFALSGLLAFISSLGFGIFSWIKGKKFFNKIFAILNLTIAIWGLGAFKFSTTLNQEAVFFWLHFGHIGVILIPAFFTHFIFEFLEIKKKKLLFATYITTLIFFVLNITDWLGLSKIFIVSLRYVFNSFYVDSPPGPLYPLFVAFFFWMAIYTHYYGMKYLKAAKGLKRMQLKYFLLASALAFSGGGTAFLMVFKIDVYPFLHFTVFFYPIIMTYAIVNYQLMDITFAVRDTTIRVTSSLIPAAIFVAIGTAFFSLPTMIAMIVLTAITSPLLYGPLRRLLIPVILGGKYGYQQKLRRISDKWFSIFSLDRLSDNLVKDVASTIGMKYCNFMIYDEEGKSYFIKANAGFKEGEKIEEFFFKEEGPLVSYLKKERTIAIKEVLKIQPPSPERDPIVKEMDKVKAAVSVPLYIDDELKGILNLGDKVSGEMYNRQDLEILSQIARDAEVMFRYSFFNYEQSLLVYRYSHDLCTPLDPVQTYLYLMQQGKLNEEEKQKYLEIVRKNVDFVAQGLSDMYQLSQMAYDHIRKKFVFGHFNITEMTNRIVEDFTSEAKKKDIYIRFSRKKQIPLAYGHEQSIERLVRNLIQNGIKFTDKGGVEVNISSEREDIRIKVSDTGPGIPRKDLPRIFNPFFKTKGRDQIAEGSGLGLTIVREIVALHGAEINVESEVGKGTTFAVLLPALKRKKSD